jgi:hypothetical protein
VQHIAVGLWNTAGVVDRLGFSSGWLISTLLRYQTTFKVVAGIDRSTSAVVAIGTASPFSWNQGKVVVRLSFDEGR